MTADAPLDFIEVIHNAVPNEVCAALRAQMRSSAQLQPGEPQQVVAVRGDLLDDVVHAGHDDGQVSLVRPKRPYVTPRALTLDELPGIVQAALDVVDEALKSRRDFTHRVYVVLAVRRRYRRRRAPSTCSSRPTTSRSSSS